MSLKIVPFLLGSLSVFPCLSQTRQELGSLDNRIGMFIQKYDDAFMEGRQSELTQIVLKIDSAGRVQKIDISGIGTDTLYKILKKMQPADFTNWKSPDLKGKQMIIPYFYISGNPEHNYVYELYTNYFTKLPLDRVVSKSGDTVIIKYFVTFAPWRKE